MDVILTILGVGVSIALIVGMYYLLKIIIAYILTALLGAIILGVIALLASGFLYSKEYMFEVSSVAAAIGGVIGLVLAILSTKNFAKTPLATKVLDDMAKTDPNGTEYEVRDQYGNAKTVKKTGKGVLGENYYDDERGNSYTDDGGSSVHRTN